MFLSPPFIREYVCILSLGLHLIYRRNIEQTDIDRERGYHHSNWLTKRQRLQLSNHMSVMVRHTHCCSSPGAAGSRYSDIWQYLLRWQSISAVEGLLQLRKICDSFDHEINCSIILEAIYLVDLNSLCAHDSDAPGVMAPRP